MSDRESITLTIIKPDAFAGGKAGRILSHLEDEGFEVLAARVLQLDVAAAEGFYEVHRERPFFGSLVRFMTSGRCMPMVLRRKDAVAHLRRIIGATDPAQAAEGTVRALYAENVERNAIHASDSPDNAQREVAYFFSVLDFRHTD